MEVLCSLPLPLARRPLRALLPMAGTWPCTSAGSRLRCLLLPHNTPRTKQKRTGVTWDCLCHSQDLLSSPEDGTLQASLCNTHLQGRGGLLALRRESREQAEKGDVPKRTLQTLRDIYQKIKLSHSSPCQCSGRAFTYLNRAQGSTGTSPCMDVTPEERSHSHLQDLLWALP